MKNSMSETKTVEVNGVAYLIGKTYAALLDDSKEVKHAILLSYNCNKFVMSTLDETSSFCCDSLVAIDIDTLGTTEKAGLELKEGWCYRFTFYEKTVVGIYDGDGYFQTLNGFAKEKICTNIVRICAD